MSLVENQLLLIPSEVLEEIIYYLPINDLLTLTETNKTIYKLLNDDILWLLRLKQDFCHKIIIKINELWKNSYIYHYQLLQNDLNKILNKIKIYQETRCKHYSKFYIMSHDDKYDIIELPYSLDINNSQLITLYQSNYKLINSGALTYVHVLLSSTQLKNLLHSFLNNGFSFDKIKYIN